MVSEFSIPRWACNAATAQICSWFSGLQTWSCREPRHGHSALFRHVIYLVLSMRPWCLTTLFDREECKASPLFLYFLSNLAYLDKQHIHTYTSLPRIDASWQSPSQSCAYNSSMQFEVQPDLSPSDTALPLCPWFRSSCIFFGCSHLHWALGLPNSRVLLCCNQAPMWKWVTATMTGHTGVRPIQRSPSTPTILEAMT